MNRPSQLFTANLCHDPGIGGPPLPNLSGARPLIVDDERAHRNVLAVMLEQNGFVCKIVSSALEALTPLQEETMDVVIAVLNMPGVSRKLIGHSQRIAPWSLNILRRVKGTPEELKSLAMGAWLHDIGNLAIPDAILFKLGSLTGEERRIIIDQVQIGCDLVKRNLFLTDAAEILLIRHECWDGSGHPWDLKGADIPLSVRIFAVADTFDAMTSDRSYRSALSIQVAQNEIGRLAGILFDSQVVSTFLGIPDEVWQAIRQQASILQISAALSGISVDEPGNQADVSIPQEEFSSSK